MRHGVLPTVFGDALATQQLSTTAHAVGRGVTLRHRQTILLFHHPLTVKDVPDIAKRLDWQWQIGPAAATRLMAAVEQVCAAGIMTPDVGGTATTQEVTDAVIEAVRGANA